MSGTKPYSSSSLPPNGDAVQHGPIDRWRRRPETSLPSPLLWVSSRRNQFFCYLLAELCSASTLLKDYTRAVLNLSHRFIAAWQAVAVAAAAQTRYEHAISWLAAEPEMEWPSKDATRKKNRDACSATASMVTEGQPIDDQASSSVAASRKRNRRSIPPSFLKAAVAEAATAAAARAAEWHRHAHSPGDEEDQPPHRRRRHCSSPPHRKPVRNRVEMALYRLWMDVQEKEDAAGQYVEYLRELVVGALFQQFLGVVVEQSFHDLVLHRWLPSVLVPGYTTKHQRYYDQRRRKTASRRHRHVGRWEEKRWTDPQQRQAMEHVFTDVRLAKRRMGQRRLTEKSMWRNAAPTSRGPMSTRPQVAASSLLLPAPPGVHRKIDASREVRQRSNSSSASLSVSDTASREGLREAENGNEEQRDGADRLKAGPTVEEVEDGADATAKQSGDEQGRTTPTSKDSSIPSVAEEVNSATKYASSSVETEANEAPDIDEGITGYPVTLQLFLCAATSFNPTLCAFLLMSRCVILARNVHSNEEEGTASKFKEQHGTHLAGASVTDENDDSSEGGAESRLFHLVIARRAVGACLHAAPCFGNRLFIFVQCSDAETANFDPSSAEEEGEEDAEETDNSQSSTPGHHFRSQGHTVETPNNANWEGGERHQLEGYRRGSPSLEATPLCTAAEVALLGGARQPNSTESEPVVSALGSPQEKLEVREDGSSPSPSHLLTASSLDKAPPPNSSATTRHEGESGTAPHPLLPRAMRRSRAHRSTADATGSPLMKEYFSPLMLPLVASPTTGTAPAPGDVAPSEAGSFGPSHSRFSSHFLSPSGATRRPLRRSFQSPSQHSPLSSSSHDGDGDVGDGAVPRSWQRPSMAAVEEEEEVAGEENEDGMAHYIIMHAVLCSYVCSGAASAHEPSWTFGNADGTGGSQGFMDSDEQRAAVLKNTDAGSPAQGSAVAAPPSGGPAEGKPEGNAAFNSATNESADVARQRFSFATQQNRFFATEKHDERDHSAVVKSALGVPLEGRCAVGDLAFPISFFEQNILAPPDVDQMAGGGSLVSQTQVRVDGGPHRSSLHQGDTINGSGHVACGIHGEGRLTGVEAQMGTTAMEKGEGEEEPTDGDMAFAAELYARLQFWSLRGQDRSAFIHAVEATSEPSASTDSSPLPLNSSLQPTPPTKEKTVGGAPRGYLKTLPLKLLHCSVGEIQLVFSPYLANRASAAVADLQLPASIAGTPVVNMRGQELLMEALEEATEVVVCAVQESRAHGGYHDALHQRLGHQKGASLPFYAATEKDGSEGGGSAVAASDRAERKPTETPPTSPSLSPQCNASYSTFRLPLGTVSHDEQCPFEFDVQHHLDVLGTVRWSGGAEAVNA